MTPARLLRIALLIVVLSPAAALAEQRPLRLPPAKLVTVDQVIAMTKAGVSDTVILALIERDRPVFLIDAREMAQLRQKGISEPLLISMIATGYYWQMGYPVQTLPCSPMPAPAAPGRITGPPPPTSTRGMFFTQPTRGIFFAPTPAPGCR